MDARTVADVFSALAARKAKGGIAGKQVLEEGSRGELEEGSRGGIVDDAGIDFSPHQATTNRLSVMTWNIWGHEECFRDRIAKVASVLTLLLPDIILLQEVNLEVLAMLDQVLVPRGFARVEGSEPGWQRESTIYYNTTILFCFAFGVEPLPMAGEYFKDRGLFWARFQLRTASGAEEKHGVFAATAHLPWVGSEAECSSGVNQRIACCDAINVHLQRLVRPDDSFLIVGGDFNEDFHPVRVLSGSGTFSLGLRELFASLDMPPPITHPVRPSHRDEEERPDRCIDWLLWKAQAPASCRPICAMAKSIKGGGFPPPSDHLPVIGVFDLAWC